MITNLLAVIAVSFATNTTETVTKYERMEPCHGGNYDCLLSYPAVWYGNPADAPPPTCLVHPATGVNPQQKRIETTVEEVKTLSFIYEGKSYSFEVSREKQPLFTDVRYVKLDWVTCAPSPAPINAEAITNNLIRISTNAIFIGATNIDISSANGRAMLSEVLGDMRLHGGWIENHTDKCVDLKWSGLLYELKEPPGGL